MRKNINDDMRLSSGRPRRNRKRVRKRARKSKTFLIFTLVYTFILFVLGIFAIKYVHGTMIEMRDNTPELIIKNEMAKLSDADILSMYGTGSAYEDQSESVSNIRKYIGESGDISVKKEDDNIFSVYGGNRKLFAAKLRTLRNVSKIGILNYEIYEFEGFESSGKTELYHIEIKAPSDCTITVNGKSIGAADSSEVMDGFADVEGQVELPGVNTYILSNLTAEPSIVIKDGDKSLEFEMSEKIDVTEQYILNRTFTTAQEAGIDFDIMKFAKEWSLFMTDDLGGDTHGYYRLSNYFINNTSMQKKAYNWATDIDITLTSFHTLNDPPFSNEKISNIIKYGENAASYEAYLEKVMHITRTGEEQLEKFNSTIYLVKIGGQWKVANIRGITAAEEDG